MAILVQKIQQAVKTVSRDPRILQYEADINRLFLLTSYNRVGSNASEKDACEIIDAASKASVADQQMQVQENVHSQVKTICETMDKILLPEMKNDSTTSASDIHGDSRLSGLSFAVGRRSATSHKPVTPGTQPITLAELSERLKSSSGYTLDIKQSGVLHKDAGFGLFLCGEAAIGSVIAFYPGVIYSPAHYRYIPGYPKIGASNSYLITRYDGTVINAQPWGRGGEAREMWDGSGTMPDPDLTVKDLETKSDLVWRLLSKPLPRGRSHCFHELLDRRNPLAFGHFANHPPKGSDPNVMICPYDFPLGEKEMRVYIPNVPFGGRESIAMRRFGTFWFKLGGARQDFPVLNTLVLVATRNLHDEELFLNYRLSNTKRRPEWYAPVDEEEDRRRWS